MEQAQNMPAILPLLVPQAAATSDPQRPRGAAAELPATSGFSLVDGSAPTGVATALGTASVASDLTVSTPQFPRLPAEPAVDLGALRASALPAVAPDASVPVFAAPPEDTPQIAAMPSEEVNDRPQGPRHALRD